MCCNTCVPRFREAALHLHFLLRLLSGHGKVPEYQVPQLLNTRRGVSIQRALLGQFMTLEISSQPTISAGAVLQKQVFGLAKMGISSLYMPGEQSRASTAQDVGNTVPMGSQNSKSTAVDAQPDSSKATSPMRLPNQLLAGDLFFHFVSACTSLTHRDCWELTLISVNPGIYYSCLVSKTEKLFCSILYFHILTGNTYSVTNTAASYH